MDTKPRKKAEVRRLKATNKATSMPFLQSSAFSLNIGAYF